MPTVVDGIRFASKKEARRYGELKLLATAHRIDTLLLQKAFPLVVNGIKIATYKADFSYFEGGGEVVEDCKGFVTPIYRLKKKLMLACHGIEIKEV